MASGPPVNSGNRFELLGREHKSVPGSRKRKNNGLTYVEPNNPVLIDSTLPDPKFIVISSSDEKIPLSSLSVFLVKKAIDGISTAYESITELRDGSLLLLVKSLKIANHFIAQKKLGTLCPISVKLHSNLNSCKGIAYAPCLINSSVDHIISEMQSQGVTDVYKFTKTTPENNLRATGLVLFTFDRFRPPSTVDLGWHKVKIEEYFPNPMRCRKCQLLGHTTKRCTSSEACENCNLAPHQPENCTRTSCANCTESHPSSSKSCNEYIKAKEILKIKTIRKCSMADAKKIYKEINPTQFFTTTYSSTIQNSSTPKKQTTSTTLHTTPPPPPPPSPSSSSITITESSKQNLQIQSTTTTDLPPTKTTITSTTTGNDNCHISSSAPAIPARIPQKNTSVIPFKK